MIYENDLINSQQIRFDYDLTNTKGIYVMAEKRVSNTLSRSWQGNTICLEVKKDIGF